MKADIALSNGKFYNPEKADILVNEDFTIYFTKEDADEITDPIDIFLNDDPVLDITTDRANMIIQGKASTIGDSLIRVMSGDKTIRKLLITVIDKVWPPVANVGLSGSVIRK